MKKAALVVDYLLFIVLFALMFIQSVGTLQTIKYLLLLLTAYFLFKTTIRSTKFIATHVYNFLFMGATIVYVLYGAWYLGPLFANITLYFFVAAIIGFVLAVAYKEPVKKIKPPKRPVPNQERKPVIKKTATKKAAKKTTRKKTAKKATRKKATKKKTAKKVAKKKTTKKKTTKKTAKKKTAPKKRAAKKTTKKKTSKKTAKKAKRGRPKKNVAKLITTTYYQ